MRGAEPWRYAAVSRNMGKIGQNPVQWVKIGGTAIGNMISLSESAVLSICVKRLVVVGVSL